MNLRRGLSWLTVNWRPVTHKGIARTHLTRPGYSRCVFLMTESFSGLLHAMPRTVQQPWIRRCDFGLIVVTVITSALLLAFVIAIPDAHGLGHVTLALPVVIFLLLTPPRSTYKLGRKNHNISCGGQTGDEDG